MAQGRGSGLPRKAERMRYERVPRAIIETFKVWDRFRAQPKREVSGQEMKHRRATLQPWIFVVAIVASGDATAIAHPHHAQGPAKSGAKNGRVNMRITEPPRIAPDDQTEALEIGTTPTIEASRLVVLTARVVDSDTKRLLPHRVHINGSDAIYYPPEGHTDIENAPLEY